MLGHRLERGARLDHLPVGGDHRDPAGQERGRNGHRAIEQATGVVAQVEHKALELRIGFVQLVDLADEVFDRGFLELAHADPAVAGLDEFGAHALHADLFADDGDREAAAFVLAEDGEHHLGGRLAAHALDRLVEREALDRGVVDAGDQVTGLETGAECRRALDRGDHLHQAVFHADLDAHADELAGGRLAELLEGLAVEIRRVWIETCDHAADGIGDELFLVDRLDV
jgi:hypothetical protein